PAMPTYETEWLLGTPDAIFSMTEDYPVPADGTVAYQYFLVPTNLTEDKWLQAMEVRAGDPKVLHHVIVYAQLPAPPTPPPTAGTTRIFQMHYSPAGKPTTDRTRVGVRFTKTKPQTEVRFAALLNGGLHIPAGASEHRVDAEMTINQNVTMWSMLPHTHVRGIRWTYEATYPDGRTETVLAVPKYDFNWQTDYIFAQPLRLPRGTKIHATAWYDNSRANRSNPDPTADVRWGDQT